MSRYVVSPSAHRDLVEIQSYLIEHATPQAAASTIKQLIRTFRLLADHPQMAPLRRDLLPSEQLRCWVTKAYLVVYRRRTMKSETLSFGVEIVRVLHQSRDTRAALDESDS